MTRLWGLGRRPTAREQRDELLSAYLDGQLDAEVHARLTAQLADDPVLLSELEALRHTVEMVRELPPLPVPRNFILPQPRTARPRSQPAPGLRLARLAPFLTASTVVVSLLFAVVLVGDLLFGGRMGMSTAPLNEAPLLLEHELPAEAPAPLPSAGERDVAVTAVVEAESEAEALPLAVPTAPDAAQEYAGSAPESLDTAESENAVRGGTITSEVGTVTPGPVAAGSTEGELPAASAPPDWATPAPGVVTEFAPALDEELPPSEVMPYQEDSELPETAPTAPVSSWRIGEIILGLASLGLALVTVWAWRVRRH